MLTHSRPTTHGRRAGFTMVELMLSTLLIALVMGAVVLVGFTGQGVYRQASLADRVESRAVRALDRIVREIEMCGAGGMIPNPTGNFGTEDLTYRVVTGITGVTPDWSVPMQVVLEYEDVDPNDGVDNDGDGLVDEGRVVLVRDVGGASERRTVLVTGVSEMLAGEQLNGVDDNGNFVRDERGFNIHRVGDLMTVRLTLAGADETGNQVVRTVETSFKLRN